MRCLAALASLTALLLLTAPAHAALQGRDLDPSRSGYEAYFDSERNVTWLADAGYAYTSRQSSDGRLTFFQALSWAEQLELYGLRGWRLPVVRPRDVAGCIAGHVSVGCGSTADPQPSELWDLMNDSLALRSLFLQDPRPTLRDYGFSLPEKPRVQVPGLDPGVLFDNVADSYWVAALRSTIVECLPGGDCDLGNPDPGPVTIGGFWSPDGRTFQRCLLAVQCTVSPEPGSGVRGYPAPPTGTFYTSIETIWPWKMDMLTDFQAHDFAPTATANVWLVRTGDVTPVPTPASWTYLLLGLGMLYRRRRPAASRRGAQRARRASP